MKEVHRFFTLLTHRTWNRIVGRFRNMHQWAVLLQFVLYNAGYVSVMAGLLYLTFVNHAEQLSEASPLPIALICGESIFSLTFISIFVIGCEEALIRTKFSKNDEKLFDHLFDMQKEMQNILMGLLSILAIIAAVYPSIADRLNRILLFCGIILFACILVTVLYERLFLRVHVIEEILKEIE